MKSSSGNPFAAFHQTCTRSLSALYERNGRREAALVETEQAGEQLRRQLCADRGLDQTIHRGRIGECWIELSRRVRHDLEETDRADRRSRHAIEVGFLTRKTDHQQRIDVVARRCRGHVVPVRARVGERPEVIG